MKSVLGLRVQHNSAAVGTTCTGRKSSVGLAEMRLMGSTQGTSCRLDGWACTPARRRQILAGSILLAHRPAQDFTAIANGTDVNSFG
jgi:hypothetical protein